ncbi:MAG: hypothetical protein ACFFBD_18500, partial [Candidatus Hodarchaeota archaeon]
WFVEQGSDGYSESGGGSILTNRTWGYWTTVLTETEDKGEEDWFSVWVPTNFYVVFNITEIDSRSSSKWNIFNASGRIATGWTTQVQQFQAIKEGWYNISFCCLADPCQAYAFNISVLTSELVIPTDGIPDAFPAPDESRDIRKGPGFQKIELTLGGIHFSIGLVLNFSTQFRISMWTTNPASVEPSFGATGHFFALDVEDLSAIHWPVMVDMNFPPSVDIDTQGWDATKLTNLLNLEYYKIDDNGWEFVNWDPTEWNPANWDPTEWNPANWDPTESTNWDPTEWNPANWDPTEYNPVNMEAGTVRLALTHLSIFALGVSEEVTGSIDLSGYQPFLILSIMLIAFVILAKRYKRAA